MSHRDKILRCVERLTSYLERYADCWNVALRLLDNGGILPSRGGAKAAARNGQQRVFMDDPHGKPNYIIHGEL